MNRLLTFLAVLLLALGSAGNAGAWSGVGASGQNLAGPESASRAIFLAGGVLEGKSPLKALMRLGNFFDSTIVTSGDSLAPEGNTPSVGYHATDPDVAPLIMEGGFRPGTAPGRLGSNGTYVNNTPEGAVAEFQHHNPGVDPAVIRVEYNPGVNADTNIPPVNYVDNLPLNADSVSAPSVRAPNATNTNVLNGSVTPTEIIPNPPPLSQVIDGAVD